MIDWELKKQFAKYINTRDYTNIEKFVLENIKDFDCQTWDMFAFANLVRKNYSKDFFDKVKPYYESFYDSRESEKLSFRSAIRLAMFFMDDEDVAED